MNNYIVIDPNIVSSDLIRAASSQLALSFLAVPGKKSLCFVSFHDTLFYAYIGAILAKVTVYKVCDQLFQLGQCANLGWYRDMIRTKLYVYKMIFASFINLN